MISREETPFWYWTLVGVSAAVATGAWFGTAALIIAASTPQATREVRMSGLSFQLPRAWTVRTDGQYALVASLSATFDPKVMPSLTANGCDETVNPRCPEFPLTPISSDKACSLIQMSVLKWPNGIRETRWVCPVMRDKPGVRYSSAVTQFEIGKKTLLLYYAATDRDTPPIEFLDGLAKSLRPE
jgi:hypothetical protein